MARHFTGHFSFISPHSAPLPGRHSRQSWDSADRRTLRRKGKGVCGPPPLYFGLLAQWLSARCLRGTGTQKAAQLGGSQAQVSTVHQRWLPGATERQNPAVELALENFSWTGTLF